MAHTVSPGRSALKSRKTRETRNDEAAHHDRQDSHDRQQHEGISKARPEPVAKIDLAAFEVNVLFERLRQSAAAQPRQDQPAQMERNP